MSDEGSPLIPSAYDITLSVIAALVIAVTAIALISLVGFARQLSIVQAAIWAVVILAVPVLGPIAWLGVSRRATVAGKLDQPARG